MAFDTFGKPDQIAHFESEMMDTESQGCLEFWFHMHKWSIGEHLHREHQLCFRLRNIIGRET